MSGGGKVRLEPKDQIRKRLGRSPDSGDAVVMLFWADPVKPIQQIEWGVA